MFAVHVGLDLKSAHKGFNRAHGGYDDAREIGFRDGPTVARKAKGLAAPSSYFDLLKIWDDDVGSHRNSGQRRVSVLDDHDHVFGEKIRFSFRDATNHQVVAGVAIQLFGLGIPCIYYGTEQCLSGPEPGQEVFLPKFGGNDAFLREAMFGPEHPRRSGLDGLATGTAGFDNSLPGFGAFGTTGAHCFNPNSAAYVRIAELIKVRKNFPVLRYARQYQRPISNFGLPFALPPAGELIAWSRILDDKEALCIVNGHGDEVRGGDVVVDMKLNSSSAAGDRFRGGTPFLTVIANSAQAAVGSAYTGPHPVGEKVPVSEVVVLTNRP